jgi:hypothetical protein
MCVPGYQISFGDSIRLPSKNEADISDHWFYCFLALVLRKEHDQLMADNGHRFELSDIKQHLKGAETSKTKENRKSFVIRTESKGVYAKVFRLMRVALPSRIKELD